jgi:hypothetical protein
MAQYTTKLQPASIAGVSKTEVESMDCPSMGRLARRLHQVVQHVPAPISGTRWRMVMQIDDRAGRYGNGDHRAGFDRLASDALGYLRSRTSEHWLIFLAGVLIGLFLG